jgi:hypothetical protein
MADKLAVLSTVRSTYTFVWRQRQRLFTLAFPAVVIFAIGYALLISALPESFAALLRGDSVRPPPDDFDSMTILISGGIALSLALLGAMNLFAVACHRAFLIDEREANLRLAIAWKRHHTSYLWLTIGVGFVVGIVQIIVMALAGVAMLAVGAKAPPSLLFIFVNASLVVSYWVFARLLFLFPATAIEHPATLCEAPRLSRGNKWRLLAVLLMAEFPLWIIHLIWQPINVLGMMAGLTGSLLSGLVDQLLIFAGIAVFITSLSVVYHALGSTPAEPAATDG